MRSPLFVPSMPLAVALLAGLPAGAAMPAHAQEPLLLRIRPNAMLLPEGGGSGERLSDAEVAARARVAREAVWQRAERRARIAIASVCTGCLVPVAPPEPLRAAAPEPPSPMTMTLPMRSAEASPPDPRPQTEGDL